MHRIAFLAAVLPAFALAACGDDTVGTVATAPDVAAAASRGALLARTYCAQCHGENYRGTTSDSLKCPALSVVRDLSYAQFDLLLRANVTPDGEVVSAAMSATQLLSDDDRRALYEYLLSRRDPD